MYSPTSKLSSVSCNLVTMCGLYTGSKLLGYDTKHIVDLSIFLNITKAYHAQIVRYRFIVFINWQQNKKILILSLHKH